MSFRSNFIKAFQKLDMDALFSMIDPEKEYCGIRGNLFYEKLWQIKSDFEFNTSPKMISKIGICQCKDSSFYGNFGVSFLEMNEGQYISFAFDQNGEKIHECPNLELDEDCDMWDFERLVFGIYDDQRVDFKPDEKYLRLKAEIEKADEEIDQYYRKAIPGEIYLKWIKDYEALHEEIKNSSVYYAIFSDFKICYSILKEYGKAFENRDYFKMAIRKLRNISEEDYGVLVNCLHDYFDLYIEANELSTHSIYTRSDGDKIWACGIFGIKKSDFSAKDTFSKLFRELYWATLKKYALFFFILNRGIKPSPATINEMKQLRKLIARYKEYRKEIESGWDDLPF